MNTDALITFATAMLAITNPIGNVAIFAGMIADRSASDSRSIAIRCSIAIAVILVATVWIGEFGVVKEGAFADLILVDGNPLENINHIADPEKNFVVIMKDGKIYKNNIP